MFLTKDPVEFVWHYAKDRNGNMVYKKQTLQRRIEAHFKYKTCRIIFDQDDSICAVCLWNISPDAKTAEVTDMVIREDYRKKDMIRKILIKVKFFYRLLEY